MLKSFINEYQLWKQGEKFYLHRKAQIILYKKKKRLANERHFSKLSIFKPLTDAITTEKISHDPSQSSQAENLI